MLLFSGMRRARVSLLLVATFLFAATSECMAQDSSSETEPCPRVDIEYQQRSFVSGGKTIGVEQFQPAASGRFPIIVMIHGSGGLLTRRDAASRPAGLFGRAEVSNMHQFVSALGTGERPEPVQQRGPDALLL